MHLATIIASSACKNFCFRSIEECVFSCSTSSYYDYRVINFVVSKHISMHWPTVHSSWICISTTNLVIDMTHLMCTFRYIVHGVCGKLSAINLFHVCRLYVNYLYDISIKLSCSKKVKSVLRYHKSIFNMYEIFCYR